MQAQFDVRVRLGRGRAAANFLTCDLTADYMDVFDDVYRFAREIVRSSATLTGFLASPACPAANTTGSLIAAWVASAASHSCAAL